MITAEKAVEISKFVYRNGLNELILKIETDIRAHANESKYTMYITIPTMYRKYVLTVLNTAGYIVALHEKDVYQVTWPLEKKENPYDNC